MNTQCFVPLGQYAPSGGKYYKEHNFVTWWFGKVCSNCGKVEQ